jgi:GNAT superfamily N-acetyltransferase
MTNTQNVPRIRGATLDDAADIARLCGELGYPAAAQDMHARLALLLPQATQFIAVAEREHALYGWIAAERRVLLEYGERAEIVGLVVDARARRTGVGQALVAAAERWACGQGLREIAVRSNIARIESHPFYKRLGFVRRKTQHNYAKPLELSER